MNPLLSTLPGDIPGLLRRGSPVMYGTRPRVVEDVEDYRLGGIGLAPEQFAACRLDLSDPTGRAHAAWWAGEKAPGVSVVTPLMDGFMSPREGRICHRAVYNAPMAPEQIDTLARLVLRLAGRPT